MPRLNRLHLTAVVAGIASVTIMQYLIPHSWTIWHNVLQHLYVVPIVIAGICFGWTGVFLAAVGSAACYIPHVFPIASGQNAFPGSELAEFGDFVVAGVVAGVFASRERRQKEALERTTGQLEEVYRELQENFDHMRRAERLYALGQLSAGLAHEIRNPLSAIGGAAGILRRGQAAQEKQLECIGIIDKESQRLDRLLVSFLDFARPRKPRFENVDVTALFESVASLSAHAVANSRVTIRTQNASGIPAFRSDADQLKQVLLNLVINAVQAMPEGGEVLLSSGVRAGRVFMQVRDQGCGIPQEDVDKIFDPFFTTKQNGTGLGLSVAHQIISQLGGMLTLEPNPGRGTTFSITLPVTAGEL